ncbi:MAG: hypothetical protein ACJ74R_03825 [Gaiellaceae bacterium]
MIDELSRELTAVGICGRRRTRILAEFADHLACDPGADLGEPSVLAAQFADDLAVDSARHTAVATFVALMAVAAAGGIPQLALQTVQDITGGKSAFIVAPATLAMILGAQVAFAAGCLAVLRAVHLGGVQDVGLVRRRVAVALGAGAATALGSVLYAVNFWAAVPAWWAVLAVAAAAAATVLLAGSAIVHARARGLRVSRGATPPGLSADLGALAQPVLIGAGATLAMVALTVALEGSVVEGLLRGAFEACAFGLFFALLRRPLALSG